MLSLCFKETEALKDKLGSVEIVQQVKMLVPKPGNLHLIWDSHGGRRELTLAGCPLTSICAVMLPLPPY